MLRLFEDAHNRRFGFSFEDKELQIESLRVDALGTIDPIEADEPALACKSGSRSATNQTTKIFYRGRMAHGDRIPPGQFDRRRNNFRGRRSLLMTYYYHNRGIRLATSNRCFRSPDS